MGVAVRTGLMSMRVVVTPVAVAVAVAMLMPMKRFFGGRVGVLPQPPSLAFRLTRRTVEPHRLQAAGDAETEIEDDAAVEVQRH